MKRSPRGYTLIELAIGLAVLGLIILFVWRFGGNAAQRITEMRAPGVLDIADQALTGFVAANNRLPCPDTNGDGLEDCTGAIVGTLPVVTLRLARTELANMRYGVFRAPNASPAADADLGVSKDRFFPLMTAGNPPAGIETPLGVANGIDFCHALRLAGDATASTSMLSVRDASGALVKNVAYAVALPGTFDADGDGNAFDGPNTLAAAFATPGQPVSATYDDTVLAVDFGQLFDRIQCSATLAAASHAHPNAQSAEAILYATSLDYKVQIALARDMADALVASSAAGVASAAAGAATAAANVLIAAAEATLSKGTASALIGFAAAAVAVSAAAITAASVRAALAQQALDAWNVKITEFDVILGDALTLSNSIRNDAVAADAAGLF